MQRFRGDVIKRGIRPVDRCLRCTVISKNSLSCSQFLRARVKLERWHSCSWESMCNLTSPKANLNIIRSSYIPQGHVKEVQTLEAEAKLMWGVSPRLRLQHMATFVPLHDPVSRHTGSQEHLFENDMRSEMTGDTAWGVMIRSSDNLLNACSFCSSFLPSQLAPHVCCDKR